MKNKMAKTISLLVALVLVLGTLPMMSAFAATTVGGITLDNGSASLSTSQQYKGFGSLKMGPTVWAGSLANDFGVNAQGGDVCQLEFYIYPLVANKQMYVSLDGNHRLVLKYDGENLTDINNRGFSITKTEKPGWWKVSGVLTTAGTWNPQLFIIPENDGYKGFECYIDELKVVNESKSTDVSFDFEPEGEIVLGKAKNLMAVQKSNTEVSVSWVNPVSDFTPTSIALYEMTDAGDVLLSDSFTLTSGAQNVYMQTISGTEDRIYRIDFGYVNGQINSQTVGIDIGTNVFEYNYVDGQWNVIKENGTKFAPATLSIDDNVYCTAAPSIRLNVNSTAANNATAVYLKLIPKQNLDTSKKYRISMKVKYEDCGYIWARFMGTSDNSARLYPINWNAIADQSTWKELTIDGTPVGAECAVINFNFCHVVGDFWADDVTLYELDESGNIVGNELLGDVGTLSAAAAAPAAPSQATDMTALFDLSEEARINWNVDDSVKYVAIYEQGETIPVAYVPAQRGYINLKNLAAGTHTFVVKSVNAEGRESLTGTEVTATVIMKDFIIDDYAVTKSGDNVTVSVRIENNNDSNKSTAQLMLAVYEGSTLKAFKATSATAISVAAAANGITLSETVPVTAGQTLKAYLWDSMSGMNALIDGTPITVQ